MDRQIIISCSRRKRRERVKLPTLERYDGPAFRLLRSYLHNSAESIEIFVLSAEFGLIPHTRLIPYYERRMTVARACELRGMIARQARCLLNAEASGSVQTRPLFINLGRDYREAFAPIYELFALNSIVTQADGSSGKRLAVMHDWLYGADSVLRQPPTHKVATGRTSLRGVEIVQTPEQILAVARDKLMTASAVAFSYQAWYVPLDGQRVAPKWLVGQLTGLPVAAFHSDEARRVLSALGIEVTRV